MILPQIGIENLRIIKNKLRYINYIAKIYDRNFKDLKEIQVLEKKRQDIKSLALYYFSKKNFIL